jgi:uncharacterized membrane protein
MKIPLLTVGALLGLASPAMAFLNVCNKTGETISVAIGYDDKDTWMAEGWWIVDPGGCVNVIAGDLNNRYYYLRGESDTGVWDGKHNFCVSNKKFALADSQDCASGSIERKGFFEVDTGNSADWTTNLLPN